MSMEIAEDGCSLVCLVTLYVGPDNKMFVRCDALKGSKPETYRLAAAIKQAAEAEIVKINADSKKA